MFKDAKEELDRLQDELLAEEMPPEPPQDRELLSDRELDALLELDCSSYNADRTELTPQELSQELLKPQEPSVTGLIITAGALTLGIFLVVCWWLLRYLGVL